MRLADLVHIDSRFEKSVNLLFDLNRHGEEKINAYIPTHSSINLLKRYLSEVKTFTGSRATLLFGPYGKGKSHLLLVLMKLLSGKKSKELKQLVTRIAAMDPEAETIIEEISSSQKFLPVIIDAQNGNLNQAFINSLNQALNHSGLQDIVPSTYFSEALRTLDLWQQQYPDTYTSFASMYNGKIEAFRKKLEANDYEALDHFRTIYPSVTSGSTFNPTIDENAVLVYQSVNEALKKKHGYSGIYIIFDEFSKYIEGHPNEGFSADMKILQDFCDLCNQSREPNPQMFLICVVHKTIRSYGNSLPKSVLNAFRGIEGRMTEVPFAVSYQNNYELIADAISKKKAFNEWAKGSECFLSVLEKSYQIPEFSTLFEKKDFDRIVGKGCFPLMPLAACLLVNLSERIAQNERTLFTFLSGSDIHGLSAFVNHCEEVGYVGADLIYDYFQPLFVAEKTTSVCYEWAKADYCLSKTDNPFEQAVIKSLAIIKMSNRPDDLPARAEIMALALGLPFDKSHAALESLCKKGLISYKEKTGCYDFQTRIGVDIETEISDCVTKHFSSVSFIDVLNQVKQRRYILPKKYNQMYSMTRYFKVYYMNANAFFKFTSSDYLSDKNKPDGYVIVVCSDEQPKPDLHSLESHIKTISDPCSIFAFPALKDIPRLRKAAQRLSAVQKLMSQESFVADNEVLLPELKIIEAELVEELNDWMEKTESGIKKLYFRGDTFNISSFGLNRVVSDICETIYDRTPVINHEMVNRHVVIGQIAKARNAVMEDILQNRSMEAYETGTSAEATIYRALFIHPNNDEKMTAIKMEIDRFIRSAYDQKVLFGLLVKKLLSPPYGLRKGVLPALLLKQLVELEDMPVVYYESQELSIDVPLMSNIVQNPQAYYLYIEPNTAKKLQYIEGLTKLFGDYDAYCKDIEERNRFAKRICTIQSWYRSLPQATITFKKKDHENQDIEKIDAFRKLFVGSVNPREVLFDSLPALFQKKDLSKTLAEIEKIKGELDDHISLLKQSAVEVIRKQLHLNKNANLLLSIKEWYSKLPKKAKTAVLSLNSHRLLECLKSLETSDYEEIAKILSKEITGLYIEDWNDNTINEFEQGFANLLTEIDERQSVSTANLQKISFSTKDGVKEWQYDFNEEEPSGPADFFAKQLEDLLEEYETSVENNEKIGILMKSVKKIIEGRS